MGRVIIVKEEGETMCSHTWKYSNILIDTLPPMRYRSCGYCGRVELWSEDYPERRKIKEVGYG